MIISIVESFNFNKSNIKLFQRNCVTQLQLYTGYKLSSTIFCCLWVRHGCFPAKRKETFFYTRWLEIEKKPKSFVGPCPLWTGDTLSVLVLRHVSDSDSFRYQAFVLVSVTNPSVVVLGKCNESWCLFVRISEIANKRLMVQMHCP